MKVLERVIIRKWGGKDKYWKIKICMGRLNLLLMGYIKVILMDR